MAGIKVELTDGTVVTVQTVDEARELVGKLPGLVASAKPVTPPKKSPRRKRNFKSPGIGPKKLWAMAMFHSLSSGQTKNDTRTALAKMKREDRRAFLDKEDEHLQFLDWYTKKAKVEGEAALDVLNTMFDENHDKFAALVEEFKKRPKSAKKPSGRGRRAG